MSLDKPSLLDLARSRRTRKGPECSVARLLRIHPQPDQVRDLLAAATDRDVTFEAAARAIADITITGPIVARHCRGHCACPKL